MCVCVCVCLFEEVHTGFVAFSFQVAKEIQKCKETTGARPVSTRNGEQCSKKCDVTMQGPPEQPGIVNQFLYEHEVTSLFVSVTS